MFDKFGLTGEFQLYSAAHFLDVQPTQTCCYAAVKA